MGMMDDIFAVVGVRGESPFSLSDNVNKPDFLIEARKNAELRDLDGLYVADPFVFVTNTKQYLFAELLQNSGKGVIVRAERQDEQDAWKNYTIVLEESFHLSYPFIFAADDAIYMTVESGEAHQVRIYVATDGSLEKWGFKQELLAGVHYDPTIFKRDNTWYMFTCPDQAFSTTKLYFSDGGILGPWYEHPCSPIVTDTPSAARPAGPVLDWGGKQYRLAQDCSERYGAAVRAFEILRLDRSHYEERETGKILSPTGAAWSSQGMHHLQVYKHLPAQVFAVSDGYMTLGGPSK